MTQSAVHRKLVEKKLVTYSRPYFAKLVKEGKIPYEEVDGKKVFDFTKVKKSLGDSKLRVGKAHNAKSLHTLPPPKEGQSKEEYGEVIASELGANPTLADSKTFLTIYQGKIAQQKFDIEAGTLVHREEVESKAFIVARVIRDQMLTLPERLSGELASTTDPKEIKEIMYKEINDVLTYLHEGEALFD